MILLSKVIKSYWANSAGEEHKVISIKILQDVNREIEINDEIIVNSEENELLSKAVEEAETIVKDATLKAQSIHEQITFEKESWEQEKNLLKEKAKSEGFSQGLIEGKEQCLKEYHEALQLANDVVNASKRDYQQQVASAERTILQLGIKVAEKILGEKLEESDDGFLSIVKRAIKEARDYREIQLHVSPTHYGFILSQKEELTSIIPKETDIYIYPDEDLSERDCIIESANGRIDASIDSQLEEIKHKLLELLESDGK